MSRPGSRTRKESLPTSNASSSLVKILWKIGKFKKNQSKIGKFIGKLGNSRKIKGK
jgi:hypothetical protein